MIKLIGETAWHHEGDFTFMRDLIYQLTEKSSVDIVKMHVTLDFDEYMTPSHEAYEMLKKWLFNESQWQELVDIVESSNKGLMLLTNDTVAIEFAAQQNIELVELHSVCLNVAKLQNKIIDIIPKDVKVAIGVGGSTLEEIDSAINVFRENNPVLFFGFQNFPTKYQYINLSKIHKLQGLYPNLTYAYADHTTWDDPENELVTLLIASNKMSFIEKHVTTCPGYERCDSSATISVDDVNQLRKKLDIVTDVCGTGEIELNEGERKYSIYGPMKMAGIATRDIAEGEYLQDDSYTFKRTNSTTRLSQIDFKYLNGKRVDNMIFKGGVIQSEDFHK